MKKSVAQHLLGAAAATVPGGAPVAKAAIEKSQNRGSALSGAIGKFTSKSFLLYHALPGALLGAAAAYKFKSHRVLAFFSGAAVGSNAYDLAKGDRTGAAVNIGVVGAAVAGSAAYHKHPIVGYLGAGVAAALLAPTIKGKLA